MREGMSFIDWWPVYICKAMFFFVISSCSDTAPTGSVKVNSTQDNPAQDVRTGENGRMKVIHLGPQCYFCKAFFQRPKTYLQKILPEISAQGFAALVGCNVEKALALR